MRIHANIERSETIFQIGQSNSQKKKSDNHQGVRFMSVTEQDDWTDGALSKDERNWATISHISTLSGCVIPLANIFAPFIVWYMKKDQSEHVAEQAKEAMNFQISMTLYILVSILLIFVVIGIPILIGIVFFDIVMTIVAAVKANEGGSYKYPLTIRLL